MSEPTVTGAMDACDAYGKPLARFYILSVKWSDGRECLTWYGPNQSGYSMFLENAGTYSAEEAARLNVHDRLMAIPVEAANALAKRSVHSNDYHNIVAATATRRAPDGATTRANGARADSPCACESTTD
jgi:hypothetical protein